MSPETTITEPRRWWGVEHSCHAMDRYYPELHWADEPEEGAGPRKAFECDACGDRYAFHPVVAEAAQGAAPRMFDTEADFQRFLHPEGAAPRPDPNTDEGRRVIEGRLDRAWNELVEGAAPGQYHRDRVARERQDPEYDAEYRAARSEGAAPRAEGLDALTNRYESALNRIANLGMDAPALGPDPADFYRDQLMTAIGTAARALKEGAAPALQATPDTEELAK